MILLTEDIKNVCSKILYAADSSSASPMTEVVELYTSGTYLYMRVTSSSYTVCTKLNTFDHYDFHATVSAQKFLKLISQMTTASIEFTCSDKTLTVKGDGSYKLPMVFTTDGSLLTIPEIKVEDDPKEIAISREFLQNVYKYNSKQITNYKLIAKEMRALPVQNSMYYFDGEGCITFTTGACVNTYANGIVGKFLLPDKVVKLFRLLGDEEVKFTLGHRAENGLMQTVVSFEDEGSKIQAILPDEKLLNGVPAALIRKTASTTYPHNIVLNRSEFARALNRLKVFMDYGACSFEFLTNEVHISDKNGDNTEVIALTKEEPSLATAYQAYIDINDIKVIVDGITDDYLNVGFGNGQAFAITKDNIVNVIPQMVE